MARELINVLTDSNGGESIVLTTTFDATGGASQTLTLNSYCNSAEFNFGEVVFNPQTLRLLADRIEEVHQEVLKNIAK